jgi:PAS domain S-box-containing protein
MAALAVAILIVAFELLLPSTYVLSVLYAVPLVVAAWVRNLRFLWGLTLALLVPTFALFIWGRVPAHMDAWSIALANRSLAGVTTLLTAGLIHAWIVSLNQVEFHRCELEKRAAAQEAANQELTDREEEIVRQNEELQSQTEELERQSEELRITNEELANREKILEQLLELSRSLTAELHRDEMLKRICEALGQLTAGMASAILDRQGNLLVIPCHHAFGPAGIDSDTLPYAQSFASLIMSLGQTGYLEDLSMRPDLRVPQPREGEPFRSVLSSPLRVRGQCVGAVEVYSTQRQSWTEAQVNMVESLAAQASISLQNAELIEAIRQERRRFEAAFRTMPFGMTVADDPHALHVRINPAAAALFNLPQDENIGPTSPAGARLRRHMLRNEESITDEQHPLIRALHGEEVQGEEFDLLLPAGRRLTLLNSAAPIYDSRGGIAGAVSGFADITAQKQLQRELELRRREAEEASARKTRFLAAVSHDIRTPVNAINLMAEVMRRIAGNPAMAAQIPEMAQKLQANALSLIELVSDVLDLARFDTTKAELQESEFLLADLLTEECRQVRPLAEDKGLQVICHPPDRPIWLRTDRVKLARLLGNLLGNAVKFTESGQIEVRARLDEHRQLLLSVRDTGIGIPSQHLSRIFDEFAQLHNPERDRTKGTGLGLAICKRLVEVLGGTLSVESKVNQGSTFTLTLPASSVLLRLDATLGSKAPEPASARRSSSDQLLVGMTILLVEDHAATRESTAQILRGEGASVSEACDGAGALRLLQEQPIDALLLDMMLPDMDGRDVLKFLHGQRPERLKGVLVLTGDLTPERLEQVKQLGADALIGKPIDIPQLVAALRMVRRTGSKQSPD